MSYILEALKKSDHERKQVNVPDLQTIHMPAATESAQNRWLYMVIVFLLVSLAFVIGWFQPWKQQTSVIPAEVAEIKEQLKEPQVIEQMSVEEKQDNRIEQEAFREVQPQPLQDAQIVPDAKLSQAVEDTPSLDIDSVPHLTEMPTLVQQAIPEMSFAGHVYSSDISQRSVIINGYSMSEGETVINGLTVEQITSNGIVFNYQGQLFRMEILQDWSFD